MILRNVVSSEVAVVFAYLRDDVGGGGEEEEDDEEGDVYEEGLE